MVKRFCEGLRWRVISVTNYTAYCGGIVVNWRTIYITI